MAEKVKSLILAESAGAARAIKKLAGSSYGVVSTEGFLKDLPRSRIGIDAENGYAPDYITVRGQGPLLKELRQKTLNAGRIFSLRRILTPPVNFSRCSAVNFSASTKNPTAA